MALRAEDFPPDLRDRAGTLGLEPSAIEPALAALLRALERWLGAGVDDVLDAVRARDALLGREVRWSGQTGTGAGIDSSGRLVVRTDSGEVALDAGEVHLGGGAEAPAPALGLQNATNCPAACRLSAHKHARAMLMLPWPGRGAELWRVRCTGGDLGRGFGVVRLVALVRRGVEVVVVVI